LAVFSDTESKLRYQQRQARLLLPMLGVSIYIATLDVMALIVQLLSLSKGRDLWIARRVKI
ncbi:MAG TPA: hypothetical protein VLQ90_02685, partial [Pyrinomonadaceae bacterium]|nr:hypothetical protein [Pyrinomonadaceae bacterium]